MPIVIIAPMRILFEARYDGLVDADNIQRIQ